MATLTKAKLEAAIGGEVVLRDLLDKDGDGVADEALVAQAIFDAEAEAVTAVEVAYDLDDPRVQESWALEHYKLKLAVYHAYKIGSAGQAIPQNVQLDYENAQRRPMFNRLRNCWNKTRLGGNGVEDELEGGA